MFKIFIWGYTDNVGNSVLLQLHSCVTIKLILSDRISNDIPSQMKILNSYPLVYIPVLFDDHVHGIKIVHSAICLFVDALCPNQQFWIMFG